MNILDMHCDTLISLDENTHLRENDKDIDLLRMKQSNYLLQNFAVFTRFFNTLKIS